MGFFNESFLQKKKAVIFQENSDFSSTSDIPSQETSVITVFLLAFLRFFHKENT